MSGHISFDEPEPPIQECDRLLGLYIRTWDQLEEATLEFLARLLGTHEIAARIVISSGLNRPTLRDILKGLGGQRLFAEEAVQFEKLLDRESAQTRTRNKLIHGKWRLHIVRHKGRSTAKWERYYEPSDPRLIQKMHGKEGSQKVRDDHIFPVERIVNAIEETRKLAEDLRAFAKSASVVPFLHPSQCNLSVTNLPDE